MRSRRLVVLSAAMSLAAGAGLVALAAPAQATSTDYTWIGGSAPYPGNGDNHSWTDSRNWSPPGIPGNGDSVTIGARPDPDYCGAHLDAIPAVTLANLTLADWGTISSTNWCAASLEQGGPVTVSGALSWDGGTIKTQLNLPAGSTATVTDTHETRSTISANVQLGGTMTLHGATETNALKIIAPYVLHVKSTGKLISSGDNDVTYSACCVNPAKIVNDGTVQVDGGTFDVEAIEFHQNGVLATANGGTLLTNSAPVTASDGASYTGDGAWSVQSHGGGVNTFTGAQNLGPDFHLVLGGISPDTGADLGGTFTLGGSGTFDWNGGTIEAGLTIGHHVTMRVHGAVTGNASRILSGDNFANQTVHLVNHGQIVVNAGGGFRTFRSRFTNASGGTVSLAPGTQLTSDECCVVPDRFTNDGGRVVVPETSSHAPVVLDDVGYYGIGGSLTIGKGETVDLTGGANGAPSKLDASTVTGGGELDLATPMTLAHTDHLGSGTTFGLRTGAALSGTGATLAGSGSTAWTGGSTSGTVRLATSGGITVSGSAGKGLAEPTGKVGTTTLDAPTHFAAGTKKAQNVFALNRSTLVLAGHTIVHNQVAFAGGTLRNSGTLDLEPGSTGTVYRTNVGPVVNTGQVTVHSGTLASDALFKNQRGALTIAGGAVFNETFGRPAVEVDGGTLRGSGKIVGIVTNSGGTVAPAGSSTGTLHITGDFAQGKQGTFAVDVAAHGHDSLAVTGSTSLKGRLVAHDVGSYRPPVGASVRVVSAGSPVTGSLTCTGTTGTGATGSHARHWVAQKSGNGLVLRSRTGRPAHC